MTQFRVTLCWLLILPLVLFSCKKKEMSISGPFPLDGAQLSLEEVASITFQWEIPEERQATLKTQYFRLLQLESLKEESTQSTFQFATKHQQTVNEGNSVTLRQANQPIFADNQIYLWEVVGENEADESFIVKDFAFFSIGKQPTFSTASVMGLLSSGCKKCALQLNDCETVICTYPALCPSYNTHIATLTNFDIINNDGFDLRTESAGTENNSPCIQVTNSTVEFVGDFAVNVPFTQINEVLPTAVEVYLFKGEELVPESSIIVQSYELNDETTVSSLVLEQDSYIPYCADNGMPMYRAKIELSMNFVVVENSSTEDYTLVFYLPVSQSHTHASPVVGPPEARVVAAPFTHTHDVTDPLDCPEDNTILSYYTCRDDFGLLKHISQHIVPITLPICQ